MFEFSDERFTGTLAEQFTADTEVSGARTAGGTEVVETALTTAAEAAAMANSAEARNQPTPEDGARDRDDEIIGLRQDYLETRIQMEGEAEAKEAEVDAAFQLRALQEEVQQLSTNGSSSSSNSSNNSSNHSSRRV